MQSAEGLGEHGGGFVPASEIPHDIRELLERGGEDRLDGMRRLSDRVECRGPQATSRES